MSNAHPAAPHHIPGFFPGPDGSDPLFTVVAIVLLIVVMMVGALYFKLHSLPEHLGQKHNSTQLQLISVLGLLALFTHNNAFWILALLIAVIRIPDFLTPLKTIADSFVKFVADNKATKSAEQSPEPDSDVGEGASSAPSGVAEKEVD